jgi:hypothetical protein
LSHDRTLPAGKHETDAFNATTELAATLRVFFTEAPF